MAKEKEPEIVEVPYMDAPPFPAPKPIVEPTLEVDEGIGLE